MNVHLGNLEAYVLRGLDQGPPDGVSSEEWNCRLEATRSRMQHFVLEGLAQARRGELTDGAEPIGRLRKKQRARRKCAGE